MVRAFVALVVSSMPAAALLAQEPLDFDRDVRPILSHHCFQCHGPDAETRKADLRLDRRDDALAVIVAGDAARSELIQRIRHADPDEVMPPPKADKPLDDDEKATLARWIDEGAVWREHWAFVTPVVPALPAVRDAAWPRGAIDRFVLARLEREGLAPNPAADRRTLLRRVTLDLTGLPPTPDELQQFLADDAPDAYERAVDRLLATPAYGEHMARFWLDAARYGDTHGLHLDNHREMWLYRDHVVRAFQDDQPFDRFLVENLAGDLLPDATAEQRIASGFNRCHITTNEGGSIEEEVYVRNVVDRVSTTGTVFLGLTLGCAVCHDHKFDPITQREFYELFAFFNGLDGKPMDDNAKAPAPVLAVPSAAQREELASLRARQDDVERRAGEALAAIRYEEPPLPDVPPRPPQTIVWVDDELPTGAQAEGDGLVWVTPDDGHVHLGARAMRRRGPGNHQHFFRNADQKLRLADGDVLFAWVFVDPNDPPEQLMLQWNDDGAGGWGHRAFWGADKIGYGTAGTTERRRIGDLPSPGAWVRLEVPVAAVGLGTGSAVHGIAFTQFGGTAWWDEAGVVTTSPQLAEDWLWWDDEAPDGADLQGDGERWQWTAGGRDAGGDGQPTPRNGARMLRRKAEGLSQDFFTGAVMPLVVRHVDRLFAWVWLDPNDPPRAVQLQFHVDGSWEHRVRWGDPAHGAGRPGGADHRAGDVPATGRWVRLETDLASVGLQPGQRLDGMAMTMVGGTVWWDGGGVHTFAPPSREYLVSLAAWERRASNGKDLPQPVRDALAVAAGERSEAQQRAVREHYLRFVHGPSRATFAPFERELEHLAAARGKVEAAIPTTLVMKERVEPRPAYLLKRGLYDQRGEQVERHTPRALPPMADDLPKDRLGLARWLIDPQHPLTARVTVNRFWQQLFGQGLVRTSEDFGNQGERPSHPALLDWLATRFVAEGWHVKALMREMVCSATYRQAATNRDELRRRDPDNRLLARGPRFRLDGETLRDQALALGGLLVRDVGGPPVKPPQPAGLWEAVGYSSSNTAKFSADTAPDKVHRRSLYTFWKRTAPPPQLTTFDAPSREECRVRRERTNTPMQALLLLNEAQYVEAARGFATRALREGGVDDPTRVGWMLEGATCRAPDPRDVAELLQLLADQRAAFAAMPGDAARLVAIGAVPADPALDAVELAAWTMLANVILNLDEVLTKG
ncbi:MAG: PSD1 domain-containing protein [Planctomycetes bacterium]|nr:PSD1 domain-containing protein [Planctomycetota bacterium]